MRRGHGAERWRQVVAGTLGLGLLCLTASAAAQGLTLTLTTSQAIYHAGEPLSVTLGAENPGLAGSADFYLAILLPDGATLVSIGPGGTPFFGSLGDLAGLGPAVPGVNLAAPFSASVPGFLQRPWTGTEPLGSYRLFFAAVRAGALADGRLDAGDLLALETLAVTLARPVTASPDGTRAASAVVPPSGGVVATTGADGTVYTLTVPPGALASATTIRVTPVTAIANLPLSGGLVAAAQLEPEGLQLAQPATLTLTLPGPVDPAGLLGFLYTGVGAGFEVLSVAVSGTTLTLQVAHFTTGGAAQGSLQDFAQQVQPLLDGLPGSLPPTQVRSLVSLVVAWVDQFGTTVCTGTDLCRRVFEIALQSLQFHRTQACGQAFTFIGQGEPFTARLALAPVLRLAATLVELGELARSLGLPGFEQEIDFACVESALRGIINLATGRAVADPRDSLLQLLFDLSGDAALLALEEVRDLALTGLRSALTALLGFGEQLCQTDPDVGEALLARPGDLFGDVFLDALDPDLAERMRLAQAGCRIRITPALATVAVGQQVQFTGTVVGLTPSSVTWSIEGPASGSTIDAQTGLFTAGTIDGVTVSVVATRLADPTRFKRASVTVCAAPLSQAGPTPARRLARATGPITQAEQCGGIDVIPPSATVAPGGTVQFTASVAGVPITAVTWTVSAGGTVDQTGLFTAGTTPGTFTVTATDLANPAVTGQAQVTITPSAVCGPLTVSNVNTEGHIAIIYGGAGGACTLQHVPNAGGGGSSGSPDEILLIDADNLPVSSFELSGPNNGANWGPGPAVAGQPAGTYTFTRQRIAAPNAGTNFRLRFTVTFSGADLTVSNVEISPL